MRASQFSKMGGLPVNISKVGPRSPVLSLPGSWALMDMVD